MRTKESSLSRGRRVENRHLLCLRGDRGRSSVSQDTVQAKNTTFVGYHQYINDIPPASFS